MRHVVWHPAAVDRRAREHAQGHRGAVVWFTGLPAAGKSTIAHAVDAQLFAMGCRSYVLDGDNIRHGLCQDLGFAVEERRENMRRVAEVAKLMADAGIIVLTAFVSPYQEHRAMARSIVSPEDFLEVYCRCPAEVCARRDPKGLYRLAQAGGIAGFTGVGAPYEPPEAPDAVLHTARLPVGRCAAIVVRLLRRRGVIPAPLA